MSDAELGPEVSVTLSRPAYRLGETVVGTIRVVQRQQSQTLTTRDLLESLQWTVVGHCRMDPRWHNVSHYQQLYKINQELSGTPDDTAGVCFWSTATIELLDLKERTVGQWKNVKPKPIRLPGRTPIKGHSSSSSSFDSRAASELLQDQQLAFTFRFQLPADLPHTLSAISCRYFYTMVVRVKTMATLDTNSTTKNSKNSNQIQWIQVPLTVLTPDASTPTTTAAPTEQNTATIETNTTVTNTAQAVAHSAGLPAHVTVTELHQATGRLTVNRHCPALYRHVRRTDVGHLQTMQVADPATGQPVAILTVLGISRLSPGSRFVVKLDFPRDLQLGSDATSSWLPCYQASACLQGEEVAIHRDGTRKRARSLLLAVAHERVDPACCECVSLPLMLPLSAPCSIQTSILEINLAIRVDITIGDTNSKGDTSFRNLKLEIPCQVGHGTAAYEVKEGDAGESPQQTFPSTTTDVYGKYNHADEIDFCDPSSFPTHDIQEDLKILSLAMADQCGLRPTIPTPETR